MGSSRQQKILRFLVVSFPVFFALVWGVPVLWADGEEPFAGIIEKIEAVGPSAIPPEKAGKRYTHTIAVRVTDQALSLRVTNGMEIFLFISNKTRIVKLKRNCLRSVPLARLKVGSLVRIKPRTLPGRVLEADMIRIMKEAKQ
ncbi:MAG: hypothetical protein JRJ20_06685 [Deltaproteobacteria bacterium]|nr:hypothetical protein [Deltaproteobacteria bacterium]MBW2145189.1 hypothetical protein [Deltaproteobacteria bacterium]